nr:disease resistance protein (TIR-NBS-LRR class) family [Tanacetum cinerariifolium]
KSFVGNVREVSKASMFGLKNLQEQVLSNVLGEKINLDGVDDGIDMMKRRMCGKKVLLVLDDVDHIDQLEALASGPNCFKPGSRIIVTTRDEQVLVAHRMNLIRDINLLSHKEAICLFSRYAFGRRNPVQGYEELSGKVVHYAAGLPLTVKVLGSFLCGKDKLEWVDAIDRLKRIPLKETLEKLELSYIGLEDDYKEIFLDIVCMLKGKSKTDAIEILESCGFHARNGLKVLEQKSLITISEHYEVLGMHDHIEEMGKNIVRRSHPDEPNKHSHLWIDEEIEDILANDMGAEETRCLKLDMSRGNSIILMKGLGKMKKLRYFEVYFANYGNWESDGECDQKFDDTSQLDIPNSLKYLMCWNYPFLYLPKTFQEKNLVGLKMNYSSKMVQFWEEGEKKVLKKLKFLSLIDSNLTTFDFGMTPNIEKFSLYDCADFVELHVSTACPNLKFLNLSGSRLRSLDLELIPNLERLDLAYSKELVEVNAPVGCLKKVVYLNLSGCLRFTDFEFRGRSEPKVGRSYLVGESLDLCPLHPNSNLPKLRFRCNYEEDLPSSVGDIEKLISFGLCVCTDLKKFSDMICSLRCLRKLELNCDITEFPEDIGQLECLEELYLYSTKIKHLPDSICMLKCLKSLALNDGDLLEKLPEDLGKLECLEELCLSSTKIQHLPDSICMLKRLKSLEVNGDLLEKLLEDIGKLECLEKLHVSSNKIEYLPNSICLLKRLKWLYVTECCYLVKLPEDIGQLECLEELRLYSTKITHLPDSICMLKHLKSLTFDNGDLLEKLPEDLGRLERLERLHVRSKKIEYLPDSICMLKSLTWLYVSNCSFLVKLPEDIGQLESLEMLYLSATRIKHLPDSICMLKHLKCLDLDLCALLERLPEDLGRLECLEVLVITHTRISHLPDSIFWLKGLSITASPELDQLYHFLPGGAKT